MGRKTTVAGTADAFGATPEAVDDSCAISCVISVMATDAQLGWDVAEHDGGGESSVSEFFSCGRRRRLVDRA